MLNTATLDTSEVRRWAMMMTSELGLTRKNSETIGFVLTSFLCSAISLDELKEWCWQVIGQLETDEQPAYLFDLVDYEGAVAGIYKPLGFVPTWEHTDEDTAALYGIALKRGGTRYEWPVKPETARAALASRPHIEERFRNALPFISL